MRFVKLGIISIIFFALFLTGLSLFFPSHVRISKATDIVAEKDSIKNMLASAGNWKKWYPGADTASFVFIEGKIKGIETGPMAGLMITNNTDSTVETMNMGPGSKKGESGWNIYSGITPGTFTVQWYMDFHLGWLPWNKFSGLLLEKRYGPRMEQGLTKLKSLLEGQ
jgi:hypothetical protein